MAFKLRPKDDQEIGKGRMEDRGEEVECVKDLGWERTGHVFKELKVTRTAKV